MSKVDRAICETLGVSHQEWRSRKPELVASSLARRFPMKVFPDGRREAVFRPEAAAIELTSTEGLGAHPLRLHHYRLLHLLERSQREIHELLDQLRPPQRSCAPPHGFFDMCCSLVKDRLSTILTLCARPGGPVQQAVVIEIDALYTDTVTLPSEACPKTEPKSVKGEVAALYYALGAYNLAGDNFSITVDGCISSPEEAERIKKVYVLHDNFEAVEDAWTEYQGQASSDRPITPGRSPELDRAVSACGEALARLNATLCSVGIGPLQLKRVQVPGDPTGLTAADVVDRIDLFVRQAPGLNAEAGRMGIKAVSDRAARFDRWINDLVNTKPPILPVQVRQSFTVLGESLMYVESVAAEVTG